MPELQQIIPRPGEVRPDKPYRTPDRRWEEVAKDIYGSADEPTNVDFDHNPNWDREFWSIQNARDQVSWVLPTSTCDAKTRNPTFGFWSVIGLLMVFGDLGWLWIRVR